jgi:hypothetical protein
MTRKWTPEELDAERPTPEEALAVADRIKPILAGLHPSLQGAALAELLSIWIAGHVADTDKATCKLRKEMLDLHIAQVRERNCAWMGATGANPSENPIRIHQRILLESTRESSRDSY